MNTTFLHKYLITMPGHRKYIEVQNPDNFMECQTFLIKTDIRKGTDVQQPHNITMTGC